MYTYVNDAVEEQTGLSLIKPGDINGLSSWPDISGCKTSGKVLLAAACLVETSLQVDRLQEISASRLQQPVFIAIPLLDLQRTGNTVNTSMKTCHLSSEDWYFEGFQLDIMDVQ